jgi:hypothetical protein
MCVALVHMFCSFDRSFSSILESMRHERHMFEAFVVLMSEAKETSGEKHIFMLSASFRARSKQ